MNEYEIKFWQEKLICGHDKEKTDDNYDLTKNVCCRETGEILTIGSNSTDTNLVSWASIAGIDLDLSNATRYSRSSTAYYDIKNNSYKGLDVAGADQCSTTCTDVAELEEQFKTFALVAEKTCCSQHWIRNFDKDENGGGHVWDSIKTQSVDMSSFKCLNWALCTNASDCPTYFSCEHTNSPFDPACLARSALPEEADAIFDWMASLELLGVPQVPIKTNEFTEITCEVDPNDQMVSGTGVPIPNTIKSYVGEPAEYAVTPATSTDKYFSATDTGTSGNFENNLRSIFSSDEITCCIPAGSTVTGSSDNCCTGYGRPVPGEGSDTYRCVLPDYTNVSLYFNRYVSSAAKELNDSNFDPLSGYISNQQVAISLACEINPCSSGTMALGVALSKLKIKGHEEGDEVIYRYVDGWDESNNFGGAATYFNKGLRWSNSIYCIPEDVASEIPNSQEYVLDCN